jgi:hypothetical protein
VAEDSADSAAEAPAAAVGARDGDNLRFTIWELRIRK